MLYANVSSSETWRGESGVARGCTGVGTLNLEVMVIAGQESIVCLTGVSSCGRTVDFDLGSFNRTVVLENGVIFGSVNANCEHYILGQNSPADSPWSMAALTYFAAEDAKGALERD